MNKTWLSAFAVLLGAATMIPGCGGASIQDACEHACDCDKNCSAKDEADCESQGAAAQVIAQKAGCTSQFDDVASCTAAATCRAGQIQTDDCAVEADAYNKCIDNSGFGGGSPLTSGGSGGSTDGQGGQLGGSTGSSGGSAGSSGGNTCEAAISHYDQCTNQNTTSTSTGSSGTACTGQALCESNCILNASCGALNGQDPQAAQNFSTCVSGCSN